MSLLHPFRERPDGRKVRYAVVGAGWIAQEDFLPGVAHTGNSEVTALVTGDPVKAEKLAKKYDIEHATDYTGYDALLKSGLIDAIYLSLPNSMHRDYAVRALEAGIHVLCEKPMAPTEEDCRAMIDACEKTGAKLMIAYRLHFEAGTVAVIEKIKDGAIGEPRFFSSTFAQQVAEQNSRTEGKLWAGPLPDMGPYPINAVRQLFRAEPTEAFAFAAAKKGEPRFTEVEEMLSVLLRFPEERLAQFTVSYGANPVSEYRICGTKGDLEVTTGYTFQTGLRYRMTVGEKTTEESFPHTDQFGGETRYFSNCVLDNQQPEPDGWEGLADVRVIKAIEESARTGQPVKIEPLPARPHRPALEQVEKLDAVKPGEMVHAAPPEEG
ncbi:MAG: Gfo/Idh/MocA family oxidoreductase [Verrucomicrobia bacterium]|nr:Gfo/Idh/MocA family oxidoreductase [Verrucomicrobiota bacterium]